jgi:hypothetical protein
MDKDFQLKKRARSAGSALLVDPLVLFGDLPFPNLHMYSSYYLLVYASAYE